jgi:hypothetical protein
MEPKLLILLLLFSLSLSSCTSEYEECVKEGKSLKERLMGLESHDLMIFGDSRSIEVKEIHNKINLLAKVSGNEQLFLKEVYSN